MNKIDFSPNTSRVKKSFGVLRVLPTLLRVKHLLRVESDLRLLLGQLEKTPQQASVGPILQVAERVEADVNRALWLLGPRQRACLPRSLTLYALLSRMGMPVTYLSGVRMAGGQLDGHAWLEVAGQVLGSEQASGQMYTVHFRHENRAARLPNPTATTHPYSEPNQHPAG